MRKPPPYSPKSSSAPKRSYKKDAGDDRGDRKEQKPYRKNEDGDKGKPYGKSDKPYSGRTEGGTARPYKKFEGGKDGDRSERGGDTRPPRKFDKPYGKSEGAPARPYKKFEDRKDGDSSDTRPPRKFDKPYGKSSEGDRPARPYKKFEDRKDAERSDSRPPRKFDKPFGTSGEGDRPTRPYKKFEGRKDGERSDRGSSSDSRPPRKFDKPFGKSDSDRPTRPYKKFEDSRAGDSTDRDSDAKPARKFEKPFSKSIDGDRPPVRAYKKFQERGEDKKKERDDSTGDKPERKSSPARSFGPARESKPKDSRPFRQRETNVISKPAEAPKKNTGADAVVPPVKKRKVVEEDEDDEEYEDNRKGGKGGKKGPAIPDIMPLNKFVAYSGECSRRAAAELVKQGKVKVNGELVLDPGHKVSRTDQVTLSGKKLFPQKAHVYILLNKPKGFITTNDDPQGRKTVMELVGNADVDRLFPVGRLDRNTSGLLLITNDGELTQKLSHPSFGMKKVYHVTLDKPLTKADFEKVVEGVELEDGKAIVDEIAYLETKSEIGLEIHSGRNRIVRRIFESMGYEVEKLDRMMYAGLTKKNLPRGKWRYLNEREIVLLKHFKH